MREVLPSTEKTATGAANVRTTGVLKRKSAEAIATLSHSNTL
jgi:hypothetical protein